MAKQRFQFDLSGGKWPKVLTDVNSIDMVMMNMRQGFEQRLFTQLKNSSVLGESSPEYKKYLKSIPAVALYYAQTIKLRAYHKLQQEGKDIVLIGPTDELFDRLGRSWLVVDQFDEALAAFTTCVEISKREGPWWPQRLCARYIHLAFTHAILGSKQEQLRASLKGAAFAVAVKKSALDTDNTSSLPYRASFFNLALQLSNCNTDLESVLIIFQHFKEDTLQAWEKLVAERSCTLQEKLASGNQVITEEDFCFALADVLVHNNRDACRTMFEILKSSSFSPSASEPNYDLATREFLTLMKVCQMDMLNVILDAEQAFQPRTISRWAAFALDLLEVAALETPSEYGGWSLSCGDRDIQLYADGEGLPLYPCCCFWISIKDESVASSSGDAPNPQILRLSHSFVPAEGSTHEELKAIVGRVQSKTFGLEDRGETLEIADIGRDLAVWAMSSSTAPVPPFENIKTALLVVQDIAQYLRLGFQQHVAKSMLQDVVLWLISQPNPTLREMCMGILLEYVKICDLTGDTEEGVICCTKALTLAKDHGMTCSEFILHLLLGITYMNMNNITQAEQEFCNARHNMTQTSEILEDDILISAIEGAEGSLEMRKGKLSCGLNKQRQLNHFEKALSKLETSLELLKKHYLSKGCEPRYDVKFNWITTSLRLSEALVTVGNFPKAQFICNRAFEAAKTHQLCFLVAEAAWSCGGIAATMRNFVIAEQYYRDGLQELDANGYIKELDLVGRLHGGLGSTLLMQSDRLPEAEAELRQAVKVCSRILMEKSLTSQFRIETFESLKVFYNDLQFCLYLIFKETPESQKGMIAKEALIVAEQGRCRDLAFNLEGHLKSRDTGSENVPTDHSVEALNWRKFDTDAEFAWEHLKFCVTACADAIKKQNEEIQRVTFVEYTLTRRNMIIWVLHSHGTQEPSSLQAAAALMPSMFYVDIRDEYKNNVSNEFPNLLEDCEWIFGKESSQSHFNTIVQKEQAFEALNILEDQIEKLRKAAKPDDRQLNSLYKLLIRPFAKELVKGEPVIFIPHEGLSFVPFAALKGPTTRGKHLIENHPIGIATSLRTLGWATNRYSTLRATSTMSLINPILLVADPYPLGVDKVSLEDSIKEVNKIATMFPKNSVATLLREQATLTNVTSAMKSTSWLHIACHGEVCSAYPQGVLFLSCSDDSSVEGEASTTNLSADDGDLKYNSAGHLTPEIISSNVTCMPAHAAVLSACKVGLGKKTGEGLLGISRAFMQVGVPLVVAPLRTVNSRLGSAFMQHMYKKMVAGENVMFALRNTMLDVITNNIDEGMGESWLLWDWAAWLAVGFPGVCLPLCDKVEAPILQLEQLNLGSLPDK